MRVEVNCARCSDFKNIAELPDHNAEIALEYGKDSPSGGTISRLGVMDHHRATRPSGGFGGHDIFTIKIIKTGERLRLTKTEAWVLAKD